MTESSRLGLIPRGSLGLKMLLVCGLVLLMGIPLLFVEAIVRDRESRASAVTGEISARAGGMQVVGGPMLLAPYRRPENYTDEQGVVRQRIVSGEYLVFAETGAAEANLQVGERRRGIYRAATYDANTLLRASFRPREALAALDASYTFDWSKARVVMFVSDARAVRSAADIAFSDGRTATLEPLSSVAAGGMQLFAAPAGFEAAPEEFSVETRLTVGGAQRFSVAAFAQDTSVSIRGDGADASAQGLFQTAAPMELSEAGFAASWRVPFIARALDKAVDLQAFDFAAVAGRDMGVSFVGADDVYQGVVRAVRYAIMFIGIVFLATLIFEALSGRRAHPAQYILVGLAQSVFYLLLLAVTEMIGFPSAFAIAAGATVLLLAYYAGASSGSLRIGLAALVGVGALYGVMYVLMTIEDFAFFAGSVVAFLVIAAAMISTSRINWYGRTQGEPAAA